MAKISLTDSSSGYNAVAATNANNALIETEFQSKVLYRDNPAGEPNQMQNDLDMNGYTLLNASTDTSASGFVTNQDLADLASNVTNSPVLAAISDRVIVTNSAGGTTNSDLTHAYGYIRFTAVSSGTYSVQPDSSVDFLDGTEVHVRQAGTGVVTIAEGSGVTVNVPANGTLTLAGQGATVTIKKVGTDEWDLMGQVVAAS